MKYNTDVLDSLAEQMVRNHSFSFQNFQEAIMVITIDDPPGLELTFDRLTLRIYSHNLDELDYLYLSRQIRKVYQTQRTSEEDKCRSEYNVLFDLIYLDPQWNGYAIHKETRPDFVLTGNGCIGIEVTEFTTELDSVLRRISNENFGKGKSSEEIHREARVRHGKKADNYTYRDLAGTTTIGSGLYDVRNKKDAYAAEIVNKYQKYSNKFSEYDEFIVLCDARNTINITNRWDAEEVIDIAKAKCCEMCGFVVCVLYEDSLGHIQKAWFTL